jgi:hypothetical protein
MRHLIICNDKGGVGKSLVAHLLGLVMLDRSEPLAIIECEKTPRLHRIFASAVEHRRVDGERIADIYDDPDRVFAFWDDLAESLATADSRRIVDMAAGLTRPLRRWAQAGGARRLADGAGVTFAVVATAEREAWHSAREDFLGLRALFPEARFCVVYNERDGRFSAEQVLDARGVVLKATRSPAWPYLQNAGRWDLVAQATNASDLAAATGLSLGTATRSLYAFTDWLLDATDAVEALVVEPAERRGLTLAASS